MKILKTLIVILITIVVCITAIEVSFFLAGRIYQYYRTGASNKHIQQHDHIKILCLGGSITFGMGADIGHSYPEQLEKLLNSDSNKYQVINGGIPGYNSSQLANHLSEKISQYSPDILIVLIGLNDTYFLTESNYYMFQKGYKAKFYRVVAQLCRLHAYKLVRSFAANILSKRFAGNPTHDSASQNHVITGKDKDWYEECIRRADLYNTRLEYKLAIAEYEKAIAIYPKRVQAYIALSIAYQDCLHDYKSSAEVSKHLLGIDASNQKAVEQLFNCYYHSGKNDEAIKVLRVYHAVDTDYDNVKIYGLPDDDKEIFHKLLRFNLNSIISMAKNRKISVYLQTYAEDICDNNMTIRGVANENNIPIIDNEPIYSKLMTFGGYKRSDLFQADCHCNNRGYEVMADNVYKALKSLKK
jgi:lysophospholipase L1-like esterase